VNIPADKVELYEIFLFIFFSNFSAVWNPKSLNLINQSRRSIGPNSIIGTPSMDHQARNQDFMWGGANETKVDQTTEMYFLSNSF